MELPQPNPEKNLYIQVNEKKIARYPIKTKLVVKGDDIISIVKEAVEGYLPAIPEKQRVVVVGEKAVAVSQGRFLPIVDIKPSGLARFLSHFVTKSSVGIGLGMPETMELALKEVGIPRILLAVAVAAITKPFGIKGMFYQIAGDKARSVDGPTPYTIPPYNQAAVLGPENPDGVAERISIALGGIGVAIIDANDLGRRVLGKAKVDAKFIEDAFADNPLGQSTQQTPVAIVAWD